MSDDESADSDWSDARSADSCEEYIRFESMRNPSTQLEEAISFGWPGVYEDDDDGGDGDGENTGGDDRRPRRVVISTLLEEDDLAPLFDGSRWAGTRLWAAAIRGMQFLAGDLPGVDGAALSERYGIKQLPLQPSGASEGGGDADRVALLELGCGLGVPGMIYHLLGGDVVLTDQIEILSQLEMNVAKNFPKTAVESTTSSSGGTSGVNRHNIRAMPLSWSREGVNTLLEQLGRSGVGFDVVVNCDCVYEPLYGKSWHLLNETIDELLKVNPQCVVLSSMERRTADGIDLFLDEMKNMDHVRSVEKVWSEDKRKIEIYITRGVSSQRLPNAS